MGGTKTWREVGDAPLKLFLFQSHQEQRGRAVPGGWRPIQLLQPQLTAALHPVPAHQQLSALQLRPPDRGAEPVGPWLQGRPAALLQQPHEFHGCCRAACLALRGRPQANRAGCGSRLLSSELLGAEGGAGARPGVHASFLETNHPLSCGSGRLGLEPEHLHFCLFVCFCLITSKNNLSEIYGT